ncbi:MAG TPA: DNA polymerase III subunit delta' [Rhodanobacteraceae bacterium]|nr:DNA polymerase III subunit delta' [Rhodanobacteraceae bacterium]
MTADVPTTAALDADAPLPAWCRPQWGLLAARAAQGALPHALLLAGPAGLGKRAFAAAFVRARLCDTPRDGYACGVCHACRLVAAGTHPDRLRVTLEDNPKTHVPRREIVVDQIRALSARLALASQLGGWQVAVIDPADSMNAAAQNALLKTLEEPSAASLIVLIADQPSRLVATIRSRCQRIDFVVPPTGVALEWLTAHGVEDASTLLEAAGGNPGLARELAAHGGVARRREVARDLLALTGGRAQARVLAKAWAEDEPVERLEHAARLFHAALRARRTGAQARFDPGWDALALTAAFAGAGRLRALLDGPLRGDLALFAWLDGLPRSRH